MAGPNEQLSSQADIHALKVSTNKACDTCRLLKIRCIVVDNEISKKCQRCSRSGQECVFSPLKRRKPRQRTDARVSELEREIRAMRAMILESRDSNAGTTFTENVTFSAALHPGGSAEGQVRDQGSSAQSSLSPGLHKSTGSPAPPIEGKLIDETGRTDLDVIDRGILALKDADELLQFYTQFLGSHYPAIVLSKGATASWLRRNQPILFLSLIAAAATGRSPQLSGVLKSELTHLLARRLFVNSEKSFELVQALIVNAIWYDPPEKLGLLKFHDFYQVMATMAQDLGLGKDKLSKFCSAHVLEPMHNIAERQRSPDLWSISDDYSELEQRRTYLACYLGCVGVSVAMRRPTPLRHSKWLNESISLLSGPNSPLESDGLLAAFGSVTLIMEDIVSALSLDDLSNVAGFGEKRVQLMLKAFMKQLNTLFERLHKFRSAVSFLIMYHSSVIVLHEIALHSEHSPHDFLPPYHPDHIKPLEPARNLSPAYADAIISCIGSSHAIIDIFLSISAVEVRVVPVFIFARVSYSLFVLAKIYASASNSESSFATLIDKNDIEFERYIDATTRHLWKASGIERFKVPTVFLGIVLKFQAWYRGQHHSSSEKGLAFNNLQDVANQNFQPIELHKPTMEAIVQPQTFDCLAPDVPPDNANTEVQNFDFLDFSMDLDLDRISTLERVAQMPEYGLAPEPQDEWYPVG
ncbi:MAG: hypothetical protein Q9227_007690 [Pyrenula ochraceoflavens]